MSLSGARSDVGRVRRTNQDAGYAGIYLWAVADGMGGHAGGDVASHIAINYLAELDREYSSIEEARDALRTRMLEANALLIKVVDDYPQLAGLGTTLSVVLRVGAQAVLAHIGDSRIYRLRDRELEQLTHDHTFVQRLIDTGQITSEEAAVHPRRSVLMRVLGDVDASPTIDVTVIDLETDDVFLLCSDGLTGVVTDDDIHTVLSKTAAPQTLANELVTRSLAEGAPDNVTVIVARDLETTSAKANKVIGSAAGENPLRSLPTTSTTEVPRAKSLSLPVHTGGLPITELGDAHTRPSTSPAARDGVSPSRGRIVLGIVVAVIVVAIIVGVVIYTASTQSLAGDLTPVIDQTRAALSSLSPGSV